MSQITRDEKEPFLFLPPSSLLEVASAAAATLQPLSDTMAIICDGGRERGEPTLFNGGKWRRRTFSSYFFATSVGSGRASFSGREAISFSRPPTLLADPFNFGRGKGRGQHRWREGGRK